MKAIILAVSMAIGFAFANLTYAQDSPGDRDCEVKLQSISEFYKGDCKNGLAHGEGVAKGTDTYIGNFENGLPDGKGKYIWANGDVYEGMWKKGEMHGKGKYTHIADNQKKILKGYWKNNNFVRKEFSKNGYAILSEKNFQHVNIYKAGHGKEINIVLKRGNVPTPVVQDPFEPSSFNRGLTLFGSSGSTVYHSDWGLGYEQVTFPFTGTVRFSAKNPFGLGNRVCELEFEIEEEGNWIVELDY